MEENKAKYKIVNKVYKGIEVEKYTIENHEGKHKTVDLDTIMKLVRTNKISNARAILNPHTEEYMIAIDGGIMSLPEMSSTSGLSLQVVARIMNKGECIGYKITNGTGKYYNYSLERVWEMASKGEIPGLEAQIIGHCKALIGSELVNLSTIPKMEG